MEVFFNGIKVGDEVWAFVNDGEGVVGVRAGHVAALVELHTKTEAGETVERSVLVEWIDDGERKNASFSPSDVAHASHEAGEVLTRMLGAPTWDRVELPRIQAERAAKTSAA